MSDLMNSIKNLREITGAGFLDCKKALEENSNNIDESIDFLRKKGLAKANKKSSREAKEGAIGFFSNKELSIIIQINTETDFAAKNEVFLSFMEEIGNMALEANETNLTIENFNKLKFNGKFVNEMFTDIISKIGENIVLSDLKVLKNNDYMISNYIHNSYRSNIGKIAVMLQSKVLNINDEAKIFGKNLCMHIAASKPLAMDINNLDLKLVENEKSIQLETIKSSGKPENIIDKILEGKMKKFYSESTFLNQAYILDPEKTISQMVNEFSKKNNFEIVNYNLLVLGQ